MTHYHDYQRALSETQQQLNSVSSSFCAAKWQQVTMHLQNGHTHSCHHPRTHVIPLDELRINSKALHNTQYKKVQRKQMLEGRRPAECDYCWRVEDQAPDSFSDRILKSADTWARPHIPDIAAMPWDADVDPSYVEVNFSNVCNFKCSYCAPHVSSLWMEEIQRHGPYPTDDLFNNLDWLTQQNQMPIPHKQANPYVEAFWNWWPDLYQKLQHFRITGGEPLLSRDTFRVLDHVIDHPNPNLEFSVNTNLNPPDDIFDRFLEKIRVITQQKKVRRFKIFTSAEAHGSQCEYIRFGMNYQKWLSNINKIYDTVPGVEFTIMSTYNILSIPSYRRFLEDVLTVRRAHDLPGQHRILLDIPYLRFPTHQSVFMADQDLLKEMKDQVRFMDENSAGPHGMGFYSHETDKLKRICEMVENHSDTAQQTRDRRNFVKFITEHDRRRGTNFAETFPEFSAAWAAWGLL